MGAGGMGGFGSPLQQMQLLQQQQMAALMRGTGGNDLMQQLMMGGNAGGASSDVRLKGREIVNSVQSLVDEHEKCLAESASLKQQVSVTQTSKASSGASEEKIARMEEKIETLMVSHAACRI
jgi:hypothetical protein